MIMNQKPRAVHFGAGNIGRGFIGALLAESGYHVVFSDVNNKVVDELNKRDTYEVRILEADEGSEEITDFSAVDSHNVIAELADPNVRIVTTAVGPPILEKLAPTLAKGLQARRSAGGGPLNVIACENMVNQTQTLAKHVHTHLSPADIEWLNQHIGFANCSVDRIVPSVQLDDENPLDVGVEEFSEWAVDQTALKSEIHPPVNGMKLTDNLDGYIERKLFTLNCGHAISAYLGYVRQHHTIDEAMSDPEISRVVRGALHEGGVALVRKHKFEEQDHAAYIERILLRFANPKLKDDVKRVARQPLRKLGREDRLLGPAYLAQGYGMPIDNLAHGIAAVFLFDMPDDEEAVQLQEKVKTHGIDKTVTEHTGFEEGGDEHRKVVDAYHGLKGK
ncbi:mannitol-1-phosphate 5-dehydrogenase [Auriscalpium vulgare]|uniref:Mannitol-1-phosphate 5-dehydrogenase n=1 Tax=Auriscalpium vulgare TaxID=40419 RepID=A0ACB8S6T0_9AGAM|nr:mannitol-1-phosphate 5-dehydrogenase [Auriscalpium vulgare]